MEKERYEFLGNSLMVTDNESDSVCNVFGLCECVDLLNQQDNRIKELEQQCLDLKEDNEALLISLYACRNDLDKVTRRMFDLDKEIERFDVKCRKAYQEGLLQRKFDIDAEKAMRENKQR